MKSAPYLEKCALPLHFSFVLLFFILPGCGAFKGASPTTAIHGPADGINLTESQEIKKILYLQYQEWKSVGYKEGGMSKSGIDCSGFVRLTFHSKFGIDLPRSTDLQSSLGERIDRNNLRAGDLVFFKTGIFQRHVGIFIEEKKFIHASTQRGVILSELDEQYWSRTFWKAKRVLR